MKKFNFLGLFKIITLKRKLIFYFLIISFIPSFLISNFYYFDEGNLLEEYTEKNTINNLTYIVNNMDKRLKTAEQLSDWTIINRSTNKMLNINYIDKTDAKTSIELIELQENIDDILLSSSMEKFTASLIIKGNNGVDIRAGKEAEVINTDEIKNTQWYKVQIKNKGYIDWMGIYKNPAKIYRSKYVLPVIRPIFDNRNKNTLGWTFIGFKVSLISEVFEKYETKGKDLFIIDHNGNIIYHTDSDLIGLSAKKKSYLSNLKNKDKGSLIVEEDNQRKKFYYLKSELTNWIVFQELQHSYLDRQKRTLIFLSVLIFFLSLFISLTIAIFLSNNLTKPLVNIKEKMEEISFGDFDRNKNIEGEDELGLLGRGINNMSENIQKLLDDLVKEENKKRDIEFKMLQTQINPHFLYNTLNAIKWIAIMQRSTVISESITSLGRFIRGSLNDSKEITISEELNLLNDYIKLMKMRYRDKFSVNYKYNEHVLNRKILKLILQPIVENAIFHGIEPKDDFGIILINIKEKENFIEIEIEDNGVGIEEVDLNNIFLKTNIKSKKRRGYSQIGIKNINERIKLYYGNSFGISVKSVRHEFTKVLIRIPISRI
ncbi:MAG: sensor histidine kinase [Clostridiales bacterium]